MVDIQALLSSVWLLPVLGVMVAADAPLPVLPSETLLMIATSVAVSEPAPDALLAIFVVATISSAVGDVLNYGLGRWSRRMPAADLTAGGKVGRVRERLVRQPGVVIVAARFLPGGRLVTTLAAGRAGIMFVRFLPWTVLSSALWAAYMMVLGLGIGWLTFGRPLLSVLAGIVVSLGLAVIVELGRRVWLRISAAAAERNSAAAVDQAAVPGDQRADQPAHHPAQPAAQPAA